MCMYAYEQGDTVWVTRIARAIVERSPLGALPTVLLTVGLVPFLLTGLFLAFTGLHVRPTFLGSQLLAATMVSVGSVLIWRYDTVVFPTFIERATEVTPYDDNREIKRIASKYSDFYADMRATTAIWTGLILVAVVVNYSYFQSVGVTSYTDPAYVAYLLFTTWAAAITAVGVRMALTTILCIREIGDLNFSIDPLHPDGLGGLSNIGYFAIRTTSILSIGALALPLAFDIGRTGNSQSIIVALVGVYVVLIVGSFGFPTVYINRRANELKQESLNSKRERIHELRTQLLESEDPGEIETLQMKLEELRTQYESFNRVSLYPMSLSIASRLISSVFLPLFFLLVETYAV